MNEILGAFILLLVVSIIAGMTFIFTSTLKDQTIEQGLNSFTILNETITRGVGNQAVFVSGATDPGFRSFAIIEIANSTTVEIIGATNYTTRSDGLLNISVAGSLGAYNVSDWNVSYTYTSANGSVAFRSVNDTEKAGIVMVDFLPILFLAIIFGVILVVVLKVILPFINLGQQGGF